MCLFFTGCPQEKVLVRNIKYPAVVISKGSTTKFKDSQEWGFHKDLPYQVCKIAIRDSEGTTITLEDDAYCSLEVGQEIK